MFILLGALLQLIFTLAPLIIIVIVVVSIRRNQRNQRNEQQRRSGDIMRSSRQMPPNQTRSGNNPQVRQRRNTQQAQRRNAPVQGKGFLEQVKEEFQQAYQEDTAKRNTSAQTTRTPQRNQLSMEQRLQQERTKKRLQAEQAARKQQQDVAAASQEMRPREIRPKKRVMAPIKTVDKKPAVSFEKNNLVNAMIYKEILDKPLALRDK
jgi:FtsZ-interacting cell division protein ZipA